jgi:type IV secretion system protein VirD4
VVVDPKSENHLKTAAHRKKRFGQRIVVFDPFGLTGQQSACFNPLDFIDPNRLDFQARCKDMANMLIHRSGQEREPYWENAAEDIIACFIAYICVEEKDRRYRTLDTVRQLVASPEKYKQVLTRMAQLEGYGGFIQRMGQKLCWHQERELASVMAVLDVNTGWMDAPAIRQHLSGITNFDPQWLRSKPGCTVYLVLPADFLVPMASLMRLWIGCTMRRLMASGIGEHSNVLFIVDEAAHLGRMRAMEDAITLLRGFGIRMWLIFQHTGQLREVYGDKAPTILGNIGTQQYFGTTDPSQAEELSKRIGDTTILVQQTSESVSRSTPTGGLGTESGNISRDRSCTLNPEGRRVLNPDEILRLPDHVSLIFHKHMPCIVGKQLKYYDAPEFNSGDGTGRERGPSRTAIAAAAMLLLLPGFVLAGLAFVPPSPIPAQPRATMPPIEAARLGRPPQKPRTRQSRVHGLDSRSGRLIQIR